MEREGRNLLWKTSADYRKRVIEELEKKLGLSLSSGDRQVLYGDN